MTVKITFWSDFLPSVPKDTFARLKPETIKQRMIEALGAHPSDADIWAVRQDINREHWIEQTFCFVKKDGEIFEDSPEGEA